MIIVPELQKVFILVPRTGSGSFYRELRRVYTRSMLLYRHAEAELCPPGYDRWERVGFVRHPMMRLWSLYNFMQTFSGGAQVQGGAASLDAERIRRQASRSFDDWVQNNREPWTVPYDLSAPGDTWWPVLYRANALAENMRSQATYLRPDLGTTILKFEDLREHMATWGLNYGFRMNATTRPKVTATRETWDHVERFCKWDMEQDCEPI